MVKRIREAADATLDKTFSFIQNLISNRYWAVGVVFLTIAWFSYESFIARHRVEGWFNGWLYTVFVYTVMTLWIDAFQKVQTAQISKMQQEQMDRFEFMLRYLGEQGETVQKMLKDNAQKDAVIRHLVALQNKLVKDIYGVK